uniref:Uncharacterized protein n=1 Tax=Arundo donax TaxID=35708 RepID=A0A0A8Y608_ARUDO
MSELIVLIRRSDDPRIVLTGIFSGGIVKEQ